jgi:hypothetical protein
MYPQHWFWQIKSTFAAYRVTRSITKFHWAVSKLPASLLSTIGTLRDHRRPSRDPRRLRRPFCRTAEHLAAVRLLDHPGLGSNKPSVLMDRLIALKPDSLDDILKALFFRPPRFFTFPKEGKYASQIFSPPVSFTGPR